VPFRIQRVPQGLLNLLSLSGGETPIELEDRVRSTLDLLQYYGLQQIRNVGTNNAAAAEGTQVQILPAGGLPVDTWFVLFSLTASIIKTATMTALRGGVFIGRAGANIQNLRSDELGPFGATETGAVGVCWTAPFPYICPPNTRLIAMAQIIGTDAAANVTCGAEVGILQ